MCDKTIIKISFSIPSNSKLLDTSSRLKEEESEKEYLQEPKNIKQRVYYESKRIFKR